MNASTLLFSLLAALLGGAAAVAVSRQRERDRDLREIEQRRRLRDELKSLSVDVLAQTGDSLAHRLEDQRRAEQERAAGEMARRSEEIKGLVHPVQEKPQIRLTGRHLLGLELDA